MEVESGFRTSTKEFDDDGRAMAQLGWIIGIPTLIAFAAITLYTANLLANSYRSPDPVTGKRNYSYRKTVKTNLGGKMFLCGIVQYINLAALAIGYTMTTSISLVKIRKLNCLHYKGQEASCRFSNNPYMIALGIVEIILSQIPNVAELEWLSILAAVMSFGYAGIGVGLSPATIIQGFGYFAFGSEIPGNLLFGSVGSRWLLELANIFIVVHLVGAYQVIIQPVYRVVETMVAQRWPKSDFVTKEYPVSIGRMKFSINMLRLVWRTTFVVVATILAMAIPFFNDMLALIGTIGFWPLVVYFPVEMSIANKKTPKRSIRWFGLKTLSLACLLMSLAAACAAIHGLNQAFGKYKPFMYKE